MDGFLVDHRKTRHRYRMADPLGACLCGNPPVGVKHTDPAPDMSVGARYLTICVPCETAAEPLPPWADTTVTPTSTSTSTSKPDPLIAPWSDLVEED